MKRLLLPGIVASALVWTPAYAEKVDLTTITCKKFFEYSKENLSVMLMWLDAYYLEDDAQPVIDFDRMAENGKKLGEYCGKHPDDSVIDAADEVMHKGK